MGKISVQEDLGNLDLEVEIQQRSESDKEKRKTRLSIKSKKSNETLIDWQRTSVWR